MGKRKGHDTRLREIVYSGSKSLGTALYFEKVKATEDKLSQVQLLVITLTHPCSFLDNMTTFLMILF